MQFVEQDCWRTSRSRSRDTIPLTNVDFIHVKFLRSDGFNAILPTEHKSGDFEHKPVSLSFLNGTRGLKFFILYSVSAASQRIVNLNKD